MGKTINFIICMLVLVSLVTAINYEYKYNPYTGKRDRTVKLNQSGDNITADYFTGQPLDGSIVSGVIYAEENKLTCGCLNITENETHVTYPEHKGRVWNLNDLDIEYCNLSGATILPTDNRHSVYYMDSSCTLQSDTWTNYFDKDINPSNYYRLFDVYKINGEIELIKGSSLIGILPRKLKWNSINCKAGATHLTVCEGITIEEGVFPYFNQTSGSFIYVATEHTSAKKQTNVDGIHFVTYESGDLKHLNQTGMNLTHCTDGTDTSVCSSALYYRHYIYTIGFGVINTQIYELAPRDDEYFTTLDNCMNFMENPHTYLIPDLDMGVAVLHSVYCGRKGDNSWNDAAWYDMRDEKRVSGAGQDTSDFMRYSGWSKNADANDYNLTNVGLSAEDIDRDLPTNCPAGTAIGAFGDNMSTVYCREFVNSTNLSNYIPYTGATQNVDLGVNDLTTTGQITVADLIVDTNVLIVSATDNDVGILVEPSQGYTLDVNGSFRATKRFQITGLDESYPQTTMSSYSNTDWHGNFMIYQRGRGTSDSPNAVEDGDVIFSMSSKGYDGNSMEEAADLRAVVDGTVSDEVVPTYWKFRTKNDSGDWNEPLRLTKTGYLYSPRLLGAGTAAPLTLVHIQSGRNALADTDEPENYHLFIRNPLSDTGEGIGIAFLTSSGIDDVGASIVAKRTGSNAKTELQFYNKQNTVADGAVTQALTLDDSGNFIIGATSGTYPLTVSKNVSGISIWAQANVSATGYITRTSVFDKSKKPFNYIKDTDYYLNNGTIDHKKFYGYVNWTVPDLSRPEIIEVLNEDLNTTSNETIYPYNITEEGILLDKEIDLLRQATFELKEENQLLKDRISVIENMLNISDVTSEPESELYSCSYKESRECLGGLSAVNKDGLQTRCYNYLKLGWSTCTTGWVKI